MPSGGLFARAIDTMFSSSDTHCVDQIIARIDAGDESNDHLGTLRAKCDVPVASTAKRIKNTTSILHADKNWSGKKTGNNWGNKFVSLMICGQ